MTDSQKDAEIKRLNYLLVEHARQSLKHLCGCDLFPAAGVKPTLEHVQRKLAYATLPPPNTKPEERSSALLERLRMLNPECRLPEGLHDGIVELLRDAESDMRARCKQIAVDVKEAVTVPGLQVVANTIADCIGEL